MVNIANTLLCGLPSSKKWGGLNGHAQFYGLFYMGVSEISTGGK